MVEELWERCLSKLGEELSDDHFETYIKPLQSQVQSDRLTILAPNVYVEEQIRKTYLKLIEDVFSSYSEDSVDAFSIELIVGDRFRGAPEKSGRVDLGPSAALPSEECHLP